MAKQVSSSLYDLVHSLSPSQQRYYKLTSKNSKNETPVLIKLFEVIDKQANYDERLAFKLLSKDFSSYNSFRVQKTRLYDSILRAMREFNASNPDIETRLAHDIQNIRFLVKKHLFKDAIGYLRRAKKIAGKYQRYYHLLSLIRLEMGILLAQKNLKDIKKFSDSKRKEANRVLKLIAASLDVQIAELHLQEIILATNFTRIKEVERIKKYKAILNSKAFRPEIRANVFDAYILHFMIQSLYDEARALFKGENPWEMLRKRFEVFIRSLQTKKFMPLIETHEDRWVMLLYGFVRHANNTDLEHAMAALKVFEAAKFKGERANQTQFMISFRMSLRFAYVQGDIDLFLQSMKKYYEQFTKHESRIEKNQIMTVYAYIGHCYLMFGEYVKSEKAWKKIIAVEKKSPGTRADLVDEAELMLVVIYGEKRKRGKLYRAVKPVEKSIQSKGLENSIDAAVVKAGKFLVSKPSITEELGYYTNLIQYLESISSIKHNERLLTHFDFLSWYKSRIDANPQKKFIELIREANGIQ